VTPVGQGGLLRLTVSVYVRLHNKFCSTYNKTGTFQNVPPILTHLSLQQFYEVHTSIIAVSQVRKLRHIK
jgi:hypothetical protein